MKLKNAYETFESEPWLREILYRVSQASLAPNFDKWLERDVRSISFYQFSQLDLNSTYNLQFFDYNMTGEWKREVKFWTEYLIVYKDEFGNQNFQAVSDNVNGLPLEKRTTVAKMISAIAKRRTKEQTIFVAILRRKVLQSVSSDFGTLQSFDIFKFPEGWQLPA